MMRSDEKTKKAIEDKHADDAAVVIEAPEPEETKTREVFISRHQSVDAEESKNVSRLRDRQVLNLPKQLKMKGHTFALSALADHITIPKRESLNADLSKVVDNSKSKD